MAGASLFWKSGAKVLLFGGRIVLNLSTFYLAMLKYAGLWWLIRKNDTRLPCLVGIHKRKALFDNEVLEESFDVTVTTRTAFCRAF